MKRKIFFLPIIIIVFILTMIPVGVINADPAIPGTNLNLYQGAGVASDSYVKFGQYGGQDILWRVLRQDNGTNGVLLISDKIIRSYIFDSTSSLWDSSDVQVWLNGAFLNGFTDTDKNYIQPYSTTATTIDNIFLPTIDNMTSSPFDSNSKRIAFFGLVPTTYWTRTRDDGLLRLITTDGGTSSSAVPYVGYGCRPMLYLIPGLWFSGTGSLSDPYIISGLPASQSTESTTPVWVRTMPMTCWQVFINEDNMFEFIFWYPYKDNNWVRIYDMEGNMVYEVDVPLKNPRIIVDLPDGMYNVKTFRFDPDNPIQEFVIGKP